MCVPGVRGRTRNRTSVVVVTAFYYPSGDEGCVDEWTGRLELPTTTIGVYSPLLGL